MTELLTCLLHPNSKKRWTADEGVNKLRHDDDVTWRDSRGFSSEPRYAPLPR